MRALLDEVGLYLWRLLPGNPIFVRVVCGSSKRMRHLWVRLGYLGILLLVVLVSQLSVAGGASQTLADHAKNAMRVFTVISYVQLALMCFLAPIFTAGAITQERDSQTYNILLTTPLSNAQIVFGTLASRLFFVLVLLFAGLPIFGVTMLYGGVTGREIILSFGIAACTGIMTGSLAIAITVVRIGTRKTIFSFYMGIAVYLILIFALGWMKYTWIPEAPATATHPRGMSWLTPFHPFLTLMAATDLVNVPVAADMVHYGALWRWALTRPHVAYMTWTLLASLAMVSLSTLAVRRGVREGEPTRLGQLWSRIRPRVGQGAEARRTPRTVWRNPVAWREARTRASGVSRILVRLLFAVGGVGAAFWLWLAYLGGWYGVDATAAREWLTVLVLIEFVAMLLLATNTAASAITRERESLTMELLLATPLTSRYIIWGKLSGLVAFTVPLIGVPWASVTLFVIADLLRGTARPVVFPEAVVLLPLLMLIYSALACMIGLHTSLRSRKTVQAVLTSVAVLVVLGFGLGMCGLLFAKEAPDTLGPLVAPLSMVVAILMVVNPDAAMQSPPRGTVEASRTLAVVGALVAAGVYGLIVHAFYRNMVERFDMIVRKQAV